jgi:hypothetical protein
VVLGNIQQIYPGISPLLSHWIKVSHHTLVISKQGSLIRFIGQMQQQNEQSWGS